MDTAFVPDCLLTIDLRDVPEEAMNALHREAERRSLPMPVLLGQLVAEESETLLSDKEDGRTSERKQGDMKAAPHNPKRLDGHAVSNS